MSILSSAPSARSFLSPKSSSYTGQDVQSSSLASYTAAYTSALPSSRLPNDRMVLSSDELFTKHTVAEVRGVQQRLRADADAKQEELRLMVGERYRDLLQASSSIISIAKSSQRVLEAIEESRDAIVSQNSLPLPPKTAMADGVDDRHLFALQVLSAHMKLLLDAPEHLWRLIERKKYLQATWLFLLARVVHRALVSHDENDEQTWVREGVDVSTDFPLVQRQWDVVSQFRSQIIHKSTLSLREASATTEDTCATLVTLHLLDSRPLSETLAALLSQRAKTLQAILLWNADPINENTSTIGNDSTMSTHTVPVREVTQVMKNALSTIAQTVCTARTIFQNEGSDSSLIDRVLRSIQAESETPEAYSNLPKELCLSTQSLLAQLTSSANFQLLPPDLRTYKPYVDLGSSSTSLTQFTFTQRLQEWFKSSSDRWQMSAKKWFSGLHSVRDVWTLRSSVRRFISGSGFSDFEKDDIFSNVDSLCHERIVEIWKKTLSEAEVDFKNRLQKPNRPQDADPDLYPADLLFSPPLIPVLSQSTKSFMDTPFQKYQLTLKRQLVGRSSRLDSVLSTLEQCARIIQHDFAHIRGNGDDKTKPFVERLTQTYQPAANDLSSRVVAIVDEATRTTIDSSDGLVFLIRVTDSLFSSSSFIKNIGCSTSSTSDFKDKMASMSYNTFQRWRNIIVSRIVSETQPQFRRSPSQPTGPSALLLRSLLSICENLRRLGIVHHPVKQNAIVQDILRHFLTSLLNENLDVAEEQTAHDLAFLRKLSGLYGESWNDVSLSLDRQLKSVVSNDAKLAEIHGFAAEYLSRTQTVLAILLPSPLSLTFDTPLLQFGIPSAGQNFSSAIDLAKPSPRFGMLLVGNTEP